MKIFHLPDLGEGLAEAEIREWYVKEGDVVKVDQPLVSMETAKAVVDVPSPYNGKIIRLHGQVNDVIKTHAPFIEFESELSDAESTGKNEKNTVVGKLEESTKKWDDGGVIIGSTTSSSQTVKALPAARALAKELNIDLNHVTASGPQGLITTDDVKQHSQKNPSSAIEKTEPLHGVRRSMALAMTQSHREVVPVTIMEDADITELPSNTDFTVKLIMAIVAAAKLEPALNAWFDTKTLGRRLFNEVNIGLAMDTSEGLFVPVIKNAEKQSENALRQIINDYKSAVKTRSIPPADMQGATITLSNFGMIAGRYANPIVVPPSVAILGSGRIHDMVMSRDGKMVVGRVMPLSFTFDHRAATGGEATRFLAAIIQFLEQH